MLTRKKIHGIYIFLTITAMVFILSIIVPSPVAKMSTCNDYYSHIQGQISCAENGQVLTIQCNHCPGIDIPIEQNQWTNFGPVYIFGDTRGFQDINFYLEGTLIGTSEVEFFPLKQTGWTTNQDFDACSLTTTTPGALSPTVTTVNIPTNNGGTATYCPASGIFVAVLCCMAVLLFGKRKIL